MDKVRVDFEKIIYLPRGKGYMCSFVEISDNSILQYLYRGNSYFYRSRPYRKKGLLKDIEFCIYYGNYIRIGIV